MVKGEKHNIRVENNTIITNGDNYHLHSITLNYLSIVDNTISGNHTKSSMYFRGNDTNIESNKLIANLDLVGTKNTVGNNIVQ